MGAWRGLTAVHGQIGTGCPGPASDAGKRSAAGVAIFGGCKTKENEGKRKPRFSLSALIFPRMAINQFLPKDPDERCRPKLKLRLRYRRRKKSRRRDDRVATLDRVRSRMGGENAPIGPE
jgi:hypothetical protein